MRKFLLLIVVMKLFSSCNGQTNITFWKSEKVTKIDNEPFRGITSAYMDMIAAMQIRVSKSNDTLIFSHPYQKKIKISELKSLTGCKSKSTGKYLDSVYEVSMDNNELQIKFHYDGTGDKENRFVLKFSKLAQKDFYADTEKLTTEINNLKSSIKPINATTLDLSIPKPSYFNAGTDLNKINPIALAEELCDIEGFGVTVTKDASFSVKNNETFTYNYYHVKNTNQIAASVAHIDQVKFSSLAFVTNKADNENHAIVLTENNLNAKAIQSLYRNIVSKMKSADIRGIGLPYKAEGSINDISKVFGIVLQQQSQTIKLLIETPEDVYYAETDTNFVLSDLANPQQKDHTLKVFNHYLSLVKKAKVRVILVSTDLEKLRKTDDLSGDYPSILKEDIK